MDKVQEVLRLSEAASLLRVTRQTLADEIRKGRFPAQKVGREFRILRSAVMEFLNGQSVPRANDQAESVALIGTDSLTQLQDFMFKGAKPNRVTIAEFNSFCDAVVLHDQVKVIVRDREVGDLPVLNLFSKF